MGAKTRSNYVSGEKWAYLWGAYMRSGTCVREYVDISVRDLYASGEIRCF